MSDQYFGAVIYDVWLGGGDPDLVSRDRVDAAEESGAESEEIAGLELRLQRARADVEREMRLQWKRPARTT